MIIGIDAHNLEGQRTGAGRYVFNLLKTWAILCHCEAVGRSNPEDSGIITGSPRPARVGFAMTEGVKFILYFKDEIPRNAPKSDFFEYKLLNVGGTAKFTHWDLPRAATKDKVDVLFCPAYVAPIFYGGKIVLTLHDISYETRPQEFNWPSLADRFLLKWVSRRSAQKADMVFTPSEFSRQEVVKYYGVSPEKVVVTLLAADLSQLERYHSPVYGTNELEEVKKKYGIKNKFAFYVGSIFTRRHLPEIISAFERLNKDGEYQLLLVGRDYTENKSVNRLANEVNKKLGRSAILRVDFIEDNELKLFYSACAFFIWLSDYEGFGLPVLEAMSLGAPVITTDGSSLSEVAGQDALLIKNNNDIEEIYRAMHKITRDSVLRQELIARGREQAAKFSWKNCAEKTLETLLGAK